MHPCRRMRPWNSLWNSLRRNATDELEDRLPIVMIYCHVVTLEEALGYFMA